MMKRYFIVSIILLSFVLPTLHFISGEHYYNPFTKKLGHSQCHQKSINKNKSNLDYLTSNCIDEDEDENCQINLFLTVFTKQYKTAIINKFVKQIFLKSNFKKQEVIAKKPLNFAPKNSPPVFFA